MSGIRGRLIRCTLLALVTMPPSLLHAQEGSSSARPRAEIYGFFMAVWDLLWYGDEP